MRIATFNCNSIRSRLDVTLEWIREHKPDFFALQETKVVDELFPLEPLQDLGYQISFRGMKAYNGVALLSRRPPDETHFGFSDDGPPDDARLLYARFGKLHIVNSYVPQGREIDHPMFEYKVEWFGRLRRWMERRFTPRDEVLWTGDLNVAAAPIDVNNPERREKHVCYHPAARSAFADCRAWGFEDVFRKFHPEGGHYTFFDYRTKYRPGQKEGWRIDYLLATPPLAKRAQDCWIDPTPRSATRPSDHVPVIADFG